MSKENILRAIRDNKPSATSLPEVPIYSRGRDLLQVFSENARTSNSRVLPLEDVGPLDQWIKDEYSDCTVRATCQCNDA